MSKHHSVDISCMRRKIQVVIFRQKFTKTSNYFPLFSVKIFTTKLPPVVISVNIHWNKQPIFTLTWP